jgi:hypothetical protein
MLDHGTTVYVVPRYNWIHEIANHPITGGINQMRVKKFFTKLLGKLQYLYVFFTIHYTWLRCTTVHLVMLYQGIIDFVVHGRYDTHITVLSLWIKGCFFECANLNHVFFLYKVIQNVTGECANGDCFHLVSLFQSATICEINEYILSSICLMYTMLASDEASADRGCQVTADKYPPC